MAKIFMSVLGFGNYSETDYILGDDHYKSRFVQKALISMLSKSGVRFDKVVFFLTKEAMSKNWEKYCVSKRAPDGSFSLTETEEDGLHPFLLQYFNESQIEPVDIVYGESQEQIFSLFMEIYNAISDGDEITFDVTHGFRTIPFIFFPVMSYAKELKKNITIEHIYYGKLEAPSQIIDLKPYEELLDCANAAHNFISSGNSSEIAAAAISHYLSVLGEIKRVIKPLKTASDFLERVSTALLNCQGGNNPKSSIKPLTDLLFSIGFNSSKTGGVMEAPFNALVEHAMSSLSGINDTHTAWETGIAAAEWYCDRGLLQQGYTAVRETVTTFVCEIYAPNADCCDGKFREEVGDRIVMAFQQHGAAAPTDEDRLREAAQLLSEPDKAAVYVRAVSHIDPEKIHFVDSMAKTRNTMNHFGMNKDRVKRIDTQGLRECIGMARSMFEDILSRRGEILSDEEALQKLNDFLTRKGTFVNFSNHPSTGWSEAQKNAARELCSGGMIEDVAFPAVPADWDEAQVAAEAERQVDIIMQHSPIAVMCTGEWGLCSEVVRLLQEKCVRVVYTCSERITEEIPTDTGTGKHTVFRFVRFREFT